MSPRTARQSASPPTQVRAATGTVYAFTVCPDEAAQLLGLGRSSAYEMVQLDSWPTPLTPASRSIRRILTLPLLEYVRVSWEYVQPAEPPAEPPIGGKK